MKRNAGLRILLWGLTLVLLLGIFCTLMDRTRKHPKPETSGSLVTEPAATSVPVGHSGSASFSPREISELKVEWVSGNILIQPGDTDQILVEEPNISDTEDTMVLKHQDSTLKITFRKEGLDSLVGLHLQDNLSKNLTITVPKDWLCDSLEIECAAATVEVSDMTIREVEFEGASGSCTFRNCIVDELDIDTASTDVQFAGTLHSLECDAASADIYAVLHNVPRRLDLDTMSGDLDITLPPEAGFTLATEGMNVAFSSDFETTSKYGNYVCGNGQFRIQVKAMSCDVIIRKADAPNPA